MNELSITKRTLADGSIRYQYRFECASIGGKRKWISKSGFKTKKAAREAGQVAMAEYYHTGRKRPQQSTMSFADFLIHWLEHDCKVDLKPATVENYEKRINLYIIPKLGQYLLNTIQADDLQSLLTEMYNQGFSRNTLSVIKGIFTKSFGYAVKQKYILHSPAANLKIPKKQMPEIPTRCAPHVYIPSEKIHQIFERFPEGTPTHIPLMFGYKCGLRLGEAFGVCWEDIDFEKKTLHVQHQVQWKEDHTKTKSQKKRMNGIPETGNGYWYLSNPKYDSFRTIELDEQLLQLLSRELQRQKKAEAYYAEYYTHYYEAVNHAITTDPSGTPLHLVCVRESGMYIHPRTMHHTSAIIHHKMNYPDFDFHSLRHTHATMLAEHGAPPKYVQERLGHTKVELTMNIYQHVTDTIRMQGRHILNELY